MTPSSPGSDGPEGLRSLDGAALFPTTLEALASNPDWLGIAELVRDQLIVALDEGSAWDDAVHWAYNRAFDRFLRPATAATVKRIWAPAHAAAGYPAKSTAIADDELVSNPSEALEVLLEDVSDVISTIGDHQLTVFEDGPRVDSTAPSSSSELELIRAASHGDVDAVTRLLGEGAAQAAPASGLTPQRSAMRHGHIEVLRLLQQVAGDEQELDRPTDAGPNAVVLRWFYPKAYWLLLAVLPVVAGLLIGLVQRSGSAVVAGLILSGVGAVLAWVIVGANALERFAFDENRFWYRAFRTYQGPVDLLRLRAVYLVPASSGATLFLLQDDAGVAIRARRSHGFDADTVAELNSTRSLRSLAVMANTSSMYPGYVAEIARHALASPAVIDAKARALFDRALADERAMRTDLP